MPHPYRDAPRLPAEGVISLHEVLGVGAGTRLELEIGPGRGGFMVERLAAEPDLALVGLEIRRKWATLVDERLAALGHRPRARVFAEDARLVLPRVASGSLRAVFVHFPDPWWKKRHAKRRVVDPGLVREVARALAPGGDLFVQTDVEERAADYLAAVAAEPAFTAAGPAGPLVPDNPFAARSPRERRALADGLPVVRLHWKRAVDGPAEAG